MSSQPPPRDSEKKQVYDRYGKEGLESGGPSRQSSSNFGTSRGPGFTFHSADDIFAQFFGTSNIFDLFDDPFFSGHRRSSHSRGSRGGMDMFDMMGGGLFGGAGGTSVSFSSNMGG